jgi:hypothetical protein
MLDVLGNHVGFNIKEYQNCKPEDVVSSHDNDPLDHLTPEELQETIEAGMTEINRMKKKKKDAYNAERAPKMTVCMLMVRPDCKN